MFGLCKFYGWRLRDVEDMTIAEVQAAVEYVGHYNEEARRGSD